MPSWPRCGASTAWRWPDAGLLITLLCIDILTRIPKHAASAGVAKCKKPSVTSESVPKAKPTKGEPGGAAGQDSRLV